MIPSYKRLDYELARQQLEKLFREAEALYENHAPPEVDLELSKAADVIFSSRTQSFREALLGCGIARLLDRTINIRHPYLSQSENAFSGRTLDEEVINPFLRQKEIPCSTGPYLATFRRKVKFDETTRTGLRDQDAYDAFLKLVGAFENAQTEEDISTLLTYLLYRFVELRAQSQIRVIRLPRLSLPQYEELIADLLNTRSGGLFPVLLVVAMLQTLNDRFNLGWEIKWQGVNVADKPTQASADVCVFHKDRLVLALEVTERIVDRSRLESTLQTKIVPHSVKDYIFVVKQKVVGEELRPLLTQCFAQDQEVVFVELNSWIVNLLATVGGDGRQIFGQKLWELVSSGGVPGHLKATWNQLVQNALRSW